MAQKAGSRGTAEGMAAGPAAALSHRARAVAAFVASLQRGDADQADRR